MKIIKGDLLTSKTAIAHQCNCMGVMGSGIARQIKTTCTNAHIAYLNDKNKVLGGYSWGMHDDRQVINLYGQYKYGNTKRHTNYAALSKSLVDCINQLGLDQLALPYNIGCGLGGGSWFVVEDLLKDIESFTGCDIILYRFD